MANGTLVGPQDGEQPVTPAQPPLLDRLWAKVLQAKKMGFAPAELDAYVLEHTSGRVLGVADLAARQAHSQRVLDATELSKGPSGLATGLEAGANAMALGLPEKLGMPGVQEMLAKGGEEHPWSAFAGEAVGGMLPAAAAGGAAEQLAEPLISRLPIPALLKMLGRGGVMGGVGGATGAYGSSPNLRPDPKALAQGAAIGAPLGAATMLPAWWAATKLNPAEHIVSQGVMRSSPEETPSFGGGVEALTEGQTTPARVGTPSAGVTFTPQSEAAYQKLPPELRPLNFEKSPQLRVEAAKSVTASGEAAAQFEQTIKNRIQMVKKAAQAIERHTETGYDAVLKRPLTEDEIGQLPLSAQRYLNAQTAPSAADLYKYWKQLDTKADAIFSAHEQLTLQDVSKLDDAAGWRTDANTVRQWLGDNVDGFDQLQARVKPYLQRKSELQLGLRQIIGRAIKPLGKATPMPKGPIEKGIGEIVGYEPYQITERAARRLGHVFASDKLSDLLNMAKNPETAELIPDFLRASPAIVGAGAGAALGAERRNKVPGLLSEP